MKCELLAENILAGDVAFITGAGSGINRGIACMFAAHGAKVVVIGRRQEKLDETCAMIRDAGGEAIGISADVRDYDAMSRAAAQGAETFGPFSIVVAGAAGNFLSPAAQLSSNGFAAVVDIDLKGSFHTFKACSEHFAAENVRCLAITAPQSQVPMPFQAHVCAAKSGVDMLVRTLALEWGGRGVRLNALSPGYVENTVGGDLLAAGSADAVKKSLPIQRFTTIQEMAQLATVLVSPLAAYMTGQVVALDGGVSLIGGTGLFNIVGGQK